MDIIDMLMPRLKEVDSEDEEECEGAAQEVVDPSLDEVASDVAEDRAAEATTTTSPRRNRSYAKSVARKIIQLLNVGIVLTNPTSLNRKQLRTLPHVPTTLIRIGMLTQVQPTISLASLKS
jgi:hypothetical protein